MTTYGEVARPQGVFVGYEEGDGRLAAMASLLAGHIVADDAALRGHRPRDFDITVQRGQDAVDAASHLCVLSFGCTRAGQAKVFEGLISNPVGYAHRQPSRTMTVNPNLPERLEALVRDELVPWLLDEDVRPVLCRRTGSGYGPSQDSPIRIDVLHTDAVPFVWDADENVIAGAFRRNSLESWVWVLPHDPQHPELWLAEYLRDLHPRDEQRFPQGTPWSSKAEWMTLEEVSARDSLDTLEARGARWERAFREAKTAIEARLLQAATAAEEGPRRMLTAQSNELTDAVVKALTDLGFVTTDEDAERDGTGTAKAHDLNVVNPDRPSEVTIAEVKGTTRAALMQAQQHIVRYAARHGHPPDRCWLIINHFISRPPDERPLLLQGADDDIAVFAESGGVLIDTRDLFRLVKRVSDGSLSPEKAREILASASGRLDASLVQG